MRSISMRRIIPAALLLIMVLHSAPARALPINSDLGLTPHKGEFIFRI